MQNCQHRSVVVFLPLTFQSWLLIIAVCLCSDVPKTPWPPPPVWGPGHERRLFIGGRWRLLHYIGCQLMSASGPGNSSFLSLGGFDWFTFLVWETFHNSGLFRIFISWFITLELKLRVGKIPPFSKIAVTFERIKQFWCPSGFTMS